MLSVWFCYMNVFYDLKQFEFFNLYNIDFNIWIMGFNKSLSLVSCDNGFYPFINFIFWIFCWILLLWKRNVYYLSTSFNDSGYSVLSIINHYSINNPLLFIRDCIAVRFISALLYRDPLWKKSYIVVQCFSSYFIETIH